MRWTIALVALSISILGLAAFSLAAAGSADAATSTVDVGNYYFCGDTFEGGVCETPINAGDTVTWSVAAGTHRVVQCADDTFAACPPSGGFDGGVFSTGATFSHTFATAGSYFYKCSIHPTEMKGKIVVAALVTASPSPTAAASATAAPTATAAAVPKTGGAPAGNGSDLWVYALLGMGMTLLAGSGFAFAFARKR